MSIVHYRAVENAFGAERRLAHEHRIAVDVRIGLRGHRSNDEGAGGHDIRLHPEIGRRSGAAEKYDRVGLWVLDATEARHRDLDAASIDPVRPVQRGANGNDVR